MPQHQLQSNDSLGTARLAYRGRKPWLRQFCTGALIVLAAWLSGSTEASADTFDPARFCYLYSDTTNFSCSDTRQDAETAMRNDSAFQGAGPFLQRFDPPGAFLITASSSVPNVNFYYQILNRAPSVRYTMYAAYGVNGEPSSGYGCTHQVKIQTSPMPAGAQTKRTW